MASNAPSKYVDKIREIRARDIHISFADNVDIAQTKFENLLISWGYDEHSITTCRVSTYIDNSGERWYTAYLRHLILDENEELVRKLRRHSTNGKDWDAYAYSKCLVLAPDYHEC
jgi:hypothetical protein